MEESYHVESLRLPRLVWLVVLAAIAAIYVLTMENGAVLRSGADLVHELFHDGRHFLGVPCH